MSDALLSLKNVSLHFTLNQYRPASWRDVFVGLIRGSTPYSKNERLRICEDISFDIHHGDRVALIGVNGAGKTSLCRCIAGFYRPNSGHIHRRGKIRALFETSVVVQAELTGRENAWLIAKLIYPQEDVRELIEEALEFSELGRFLDVPLRTYSKGMLARLGLSLSALKGADLLILDEVFDGADVFFREKISRRMSEVVDRSGAVIFVSHSAEQIRRVCNRLLLLEGGAIVFDGPVEEGLRRFHGGKVPKPHDSLPPAPPAPPEPPEPPAPPQIFSDAEL